MKEAYDNAALRHWDDATLLSDGAGSEANADQLFGFAAECGLKHALSQVGIAVRDTAGKGGYRKHINTLWKSVSSPQVWKRFPGLAALLKKPNPFADWSTDQRYYPREAVSSKALQSHREHAMRVLSAVSLWGQRRGVKP